MARTMFHRALISVLLLLVAKLVLVPAPAPAGEMHRPTMWASASDLVLDKALTISGRGPGPLRSVQVQMRTAENGWQPLVWVRTGLDASYRVRLRLWYGVHRLRAVASDTLLTQPWVSPVRTVRVRTPYRPRGSAKDWEWLSSSGARWDPCRAITYRINPRGSHRGATADIAAAFRAVTRVTGFRFQDLGSTHRAVRRDRPGSHPRGTDILVDWQTPRQDRGLVGRVAGIGGHWVLGGRRYDGYIILDRTARHSRRTWRQIIVHELGHVLGLGHARSHTQVMHGVSSEKNLRWGAGDLAGMQRIGASRGCL